MMKLIVISHLIITSLPISEKKLKLFREETDKDPALNTVKTYVLQGWPDEGDPPTIKFAAIKDEISYHNGLLLRGSRIIVPSSLREEIKNTIHQGHLGMEKCKLRARSTVYWPNINQHIENFVRNCNKCLDYRNRQNPELVLNHEIPECPWI